MEVFEAKVKHTVILDNGRSSRDTDIIVVSGCDTYSEAETHTNEVIEKFKFNDPYIDTIKKIKFSLKPRINFAYEHAYLVGAETENLDGGNPLKDLFLISGYSPAHAIEQAPEIVNPDDTDLVEIKKVVETPLDFFSYLDGDQRYITTNREVPKKEPSLFDDDEAYQATVQKN